MEPLQRAFMYVIFEVEKGTILVYRVKGRGKENLAAPLPPL